MDINWLSKTRSAGIGILLWVFGIGGLIFFKGKRTLFAILWIVFFLLALGPFIYSGEDIISKAPLHFLYEKFNINQLFRIGIRAFFICIMVFAVTAGFFLDRTFTRRKIPKYFLVLILVLFFIENVPYTFQKYNSVELTKHEVDYSFMEEDAVLLNLPSVIMVGFYFDYLCNPTEDYEFPQVREYLYMYYQTRHKRNILNSVCSFYPKSIMENQRLIQKIQEDDNLEQLISLNGIDYIVFHKEFTNGCSFDELLQFLSNYPRLEKTKESEEVVIYKVRS